MKIILDKDSVMGGYPLEISALNPFYESIAKHFYAMADDEEAPCGTRDFAAGKAAAYAAVARQFLGAQISRGLNARKPGSICSTRAHLHSLRTPPQRARPPKNFFGKPLNGTGAVPPAPRAKLRAGDPHPIG